MTAYQMTSMLEGVVQRGTGTAAKAIGKPVAGKTGTTNDYHDAWFVGFSPDLVAARLCRLRQAALARPWRRRAARSPRRSSPNSCRWRSPTSRRCRSACRRACRSSRSTSKTGLRANPGDPGTILEAFKPGTAPPDTYSIIGYTDTMGRPLTVAPESDRAVISGTGGLY